MTTPFHLHLPRNLLQDMLDLAHAELPNECCGLVAGHIERDGKITVVRAERLHPLINASASPVRYSANPKELLAAFRDMRSTGLEHVAIYHSHPTSEPVPSKTDLAEWYYGPEVMCLILSLVSGEPRLRAWHLCEEGSVPANWD